MNVASVWDPEQATGNSASEKRVHSGAVTSASKWTFAATTVNVGSVNRENAASQVVAGSEGLIRPRLRSGVTARAMAVPVQLGKACIHHRHL